MRKLNVCPHPYIKEEGLLLTTGSLPTHTMVSQVKQCRHLSLLPFWFGSLQFLSVVEFQRNKGYRQIQYITNKRHSILTIAELSRFSLIRSRSLSLALMQLESLCQLLASITVCFAEVIYTHSSSILAHRIVYSILSIFVCNEKWRTF